jgi:hypothetical protein
MEAGRCSALAGIGVPTAAPTAPTATNTTAAPTIRRRTLDIAESLNTALRCRAIVTGHPRTGRRANGAVPTRMTCAPHDLSNAQLSVDQRPQEQPALGGMSQGMPRSPNPSGDVTVRRRQVRPPRQAGPQPVTFHGRPANRRLGARRRRGRDGGWSRLVAVEGETGTGGGEAQASATAPPGAGQAEHPEVRA